MTGAPEGLEALGARLARDLEILQYPPPDWVVPRFTAARERVSDVVVVGAGMCGLAAGFALQRAGIGAIRILDQADAGREGPWVTYARMETLRSPKVLAGPALGLPSLAFRSWYEARWGADAWQSLDRIPRAMWMDYLVWYRNVLGLPVENGRKVIRIAPAAHGFDVETHGAGGPRTLPARRVVLATGREGMARPRVPPPLAPHLGAKCRHSSEAIDFAAMAGKRVAVIGFSASAVDNAAEALEAGAASVDMLVRAGAAPRVNKMKSTTYPGFTHGFPGLDAGERLELLSYVLTCRIAPPRDSVLRVFAHGNARLHLDAEVTAMRAPGGAFELETREAVFPADHVIYCTGFRIDVAAPPETRAFAGAIRTFRDMVASPREDWIDEFLDFPDLGPAFEFGEKTPGAAPFLAGLHNFTFAATVAQGNVASDIPCISDGAERLARGIAASIFREDFAAHRAALEAYVDPELMGDEIAGIRSWDPPA